MGHLPCYVVNAPQSLICKASFFSGWKAHKHGNCVRGNDWRFSTDLSAGCVPGEVDSGLQAPSIQHQLIPRTPGT